MSVIGLIEQARSQGVTLYLDGDALKFRANGAPLSDDLKAQLKANKAELIAFLGRRQQVLPDRDPALDDCPAPLTYGQQRMYFLHAADGGASHYNMAFCFDLDGPLAADQLEAALRAIVGRHAVLRSTYQRTGEGIEQVPGQAAAFALGRVFAADEAAADAQLAALSAVPFDLSVDFPLRATLIAMGATRARLSLVFHHIAFDGWSYGLFLDELSAQMAGRDVALPPYQMADVARWQQNSEDTGRDYWETRLSGVEMLNSLPADHPRRPNTAYQAQTLTTRIDTATLARMDDFAREQGMTRFSLMQAVLAVVLARWSGRDYAVLGTPVAGRGHPAFDAMIGLFANTLPLKTEVDSEQSFVNFARKADAALRDDLAHQYVPLDQIINTVSSHRDPAFPPLLQVLFAMGEPEADRLVIPGCMARPRLVDRNTVNFELEVHAQPDASGVELSFGYAANLFDSETIAGFADSYVTFLKASLASPDMAVGRIPITSDSMLVRLDQWNIAACRVAPYDSFPARFARQVADAPDAIACQTETQSWTYRALDDASGAVAAELVVAGVQQGDFIGLSVERGFDMVLGLLAILKAGAAYVPLDGRLPQARLTQVMEDCAPRIVLGDASTPAWLKNDGFIELGGPRTTTPVPAVKDLSPDLPAYAIFTSGTTGRPKGVVITHSNLSSFLSGTAQLTSLHGGCVIPLLTAISFDVHVFEIQHALASGATIALPGEADVTDPVRLADRLASLGVTDIHATPATFAMLCDAGWQPTNSTRLYSGGDALPEDLKHRLLSAGEDLRLWNFYGPTEATVYISATEMLPNRPVCVGQAMPGNGFHVLNDDLAPSPPGVTGRLFLSGQNLAQGYLGRADLTLDRFPTDPFSGQRLYDTGDLARWTHDGRLQILGRADFQVKIRGYRVELGEIETRLAARSDVTEAVAVPTCDGNALNAFVRPVPSDAQIAEMRSELAAHLPAYMIPAQIVGLEEMPKTAANKVDRAALSQMSVDAPKVIVVAESPEEKLIEAIWADLLGLERIDVFASFFELGGHSLLAIRMLGRVEAQTGTIIPLRSLLMAPTIAGLAQLLVGVRPDAEDDASQEVLL